MPKRETSPSSAESGGGSQAFDDAVSRDWLPPLAQSPDCQPERDPEGGAWHDWLPARGQSPDDME